MVWARSSPSHPEATIMIGPQTDWCSPPEIDAQERSREYGVWFERVVVLCLMHGLQLAYAVQSTYSGLEKSGVGIDAPTGAKNPI